MLLVSPIETPLKIVHSFNLVNTFYDLFRYIYKSPDSPDSHRKKPILFIRKIEKQNLFPYLLSCQYGVMLSFEKPIYLNGYFLGFEGWDSLNQQFGSSNISFIVRVEFELSTFKENRIKRRFKLFWSVLYKYFRCFY